ncbi:protein translocase subunit SecDF [Mediterranea sp. An20]|uniref:protein translocase subunit SecDF n=1 Tax=Mediterranea sp. An20 TaxID=1965586 RepID=UPI000B3AB6C3|nr:protein translocase subunit SecDF [Mediterranea sp. An20]OUP11259.1 protein translocase subunit SecDF [Mediterranea sp. An20]
MQNKGFVRVFAVLLTLVCLFYLSFSFVTRYYTNKAKEYAKGDAQIEQDYLDSLSNEKVYFGNWTLKDCREMEISLGLDLKGGMNVILEVSIPDVIKVLADNKPDEAFNQALANAAQQAKSSQEDVITLFIREYHRLAPDATLAQLFATQQLKDKVNQQSTDAEVEKVLREEVKAAIDNSYNVLRTRIDRFGVVQPNIQSLSDNLGRIMVELPGIKEPERVRKLLQGSANLEFWETYMARDVVPYLQAADSKIHSIQSLEENSAEVKTDSTATAAVEEKKAISTADSLAAALKGESTAAADLEAYKKQNPLLAILSVNPSAQSPIVGFANYKDTAEINRYLAMPEVKATFPKDLRLKWGVSPSDLDPKKQTFELYAIRSTQRDGRAPLEGDVISSASDDYNQYGKPCVNMTMNTDGARRWAQLTKQNIGRAIAIVLDGYVYSAPTVETEIPDGSSVISGSFTPEQTKDLANVLRSGKMPAPAHIVQEDIVGPSLGAASIQAGFISCVVAFILLMVYTCSMYGFIPGMVVNAALLLNVFFTFGILTSFQAALTMSGIAGMVLAIGMAVDANVLIYERTKEELRNGKTVKMALQDGYKNAFSAIFDSNFTSIITGIILFYFGTGPIRGFATTQIIGIAISFFTAVYLTRLVYDYFMSKDKWQHLTFETKLSRGVLQDTHFDFMGRNKTWAIGTVVFVVLWIGFLGARGLSQSIDFTGGRNYQVRFDQPTQPEQLREVLEGNLDDANVSVIAIGTDGRTMRISTNYRIAEEGANVDAEIEAKLYELLKPLLTEGTTLEQFVDRDNQEGGTIISSQKVGPSIADDTTVAAFWAVFFALIAIGLYILFRFRNIAFSVGSIAALAFDTLGILGIYSMFWGILPFSMEIDQTFVGAILTAIGYSINDKVVIFDRVREFLHLYPKRNTYRLFNDSLNSTLTRTLFTGSSTLIVLVVIFFLGGESIRSFSFAMILGVVIGTFSSLFIGSPIAYAMMHKKRDAGKDIEKDEK